MVDTDVDVIQGKADKLYEELCGTCQGMPDWVEEDPDEQEIYRATDQLMFCCAQCGWWCDISEANENPEGSENGDLCADCHEDSED